MVFTLDFDTPLGATCDFWWTNDTNDLNQLIIVALIVISLPSINLAKVACCNNL